MCKSRDDLGPRLGRGFNTSEAVVGLSNAAERGRALSHRGLPVHSQTRDRTHVCVRADVCVYETVSHTKRNLSRHEASILYHVSNGCQGSHESFHFLLPTVVVYKHVENMAHPVLRPDVITRDI